MNFLELKELQLMVMKSIQEKSTEGPIEILKHIKEVAPLTNEERFSIYKNGYSIRLRSVIDTDHENLGLYLGDELYDLMVVKYIEKYPSHYKSLRYFCTNIPKFLTEEKPFSESPVLAYIARFERLLQDVFDAKDAPQISFEQLQSIPPNDWPQLIIQFHPSLAIFESKYRAVNCWKAIKDKVSPPEADEEGEVQNWLLWRNTSSVTEYRTIEKAELLFLESLVLGEKLEFSADKLTDFYGDKTGEYIISFLRAWFNDGIISSLEVSI
jgi:hypothetical protein